MRTDASPAGKADAVLDLRSKKCPMTFVYTKLALEKLDHGQVLEVMLDYPPSFINVPRSVQLQKLGEVVFETPEAGGEKKLWIKKA